jgi:rfaE bifunctional protein kinase chain/domain
VVVDPNPTPIDNIRALQPDYFAKGYEYTASGRLPARTQEELDTVKSYGGEMLFTPGDVVYSSSALIEAFPPKLQIEKLLALLDSEGVGFGDLRAAIGAMRGVRVHVIGDTIVDSYSTCSLLGATAKSPTFSVKHERTDVFSGGAAVVAKHMKAAGAEVTFSTVLGDDDLKAFVLDDLAKAGVQVHPCVDRTRPTTHKERFIADGHKMLQVDRVDNRTISDTIVETLRDQLRDVPTDAVVFSDFRHGLFNRLTIDTLIAAVPSGAVKIADSQVSNRWGNILDFKGFDLLTPNEREARFALGDQDSVVRPLASELFRQAGCRYLILKLAERGIIGYRGAGPQPREFFTVESFVDRLVDPIGAGDALLAHATLALVATENFVSASVLGSIGAAIACEHQGNEPITLEQVAAKLDAIERQASFS